MAPFPSWATNPKIVEATNSASPFSNFGILLASLHSVSTVINKQHKVSEGKLVSGCYLFDR